MSHSQRRRPYDTTLGISQEPLAQTAQAAAEKLLSAAGKGDAALGEARAAILRIGASQHPAFFECLIGATALLGIAHNGAQATGYYAAEIQARITLQKLFPELISHQIADVASDMAEWRS